MSWTRERGGAAADRSSLLAPRCAHAFGPGDRSRGVSYSSAGRVRLGPVDENGVLARVAGSRRTPYSVLVDWGDVEWGDGLLVACDCPRFEDGILCKHLWATLHALDAAGEGRWVPGRGRLEVIPEYGFGLEEAEDEEMDGGGIGGSGFGAPAVEPERDRSVSGEPGPGAPPRASRWDDAADPPTAWRRQLDVVGHALEQLAGAGAGAAARGSTTPGRALGPGPGDRRREVWYAINRSVSAARGRLVIDLFQRQERKNGDLGAIKPLSLDEETAAGLASSQDRELARLVLSLPSEQGTWSVGSPGLSMPSSVAGRQRRPPMGRFSVPGPFYATVLPRLTATGRLIWWEGDDDRPGDAQRLTWDGGAPWRLALRLDRNESRDGASLTGVLERSGGERAPGEETGEANGAEGGSGARRIALDVPVLLLAEGLAVFEDHLARLAARDEFPWIVLLRREGSIDIPEEDLALALEQLFQLPSVPSFELPDDLPVEHARPTPQPRLSLAYTETESGSPDFEGELAFGYHGVWLAADDPRSGLIEGGGPDAEGTRDSRLLLRDREAEERAIGRLRELGVETPGGGTQTEGGVAIPAERLAGVVERLLDEGWKVEAEGERVRRSGPFQASIGGTGVDWFELRGALAFDGEAVPLPRLLTAARRGMDFVELDDGSYGMLPREWMERFARLADLVPGGLADDESDEGDGSVRFLPSQALLLDTLLAAAPAVDVDERFAAIRTRLETSHEVEPEEPPVGFEGTLRGYQKVGLGWLTLLGELGLGGCLADDMGLGKTIQVLALLEKRRAAPAGGSAEDPTTESGRRPSLVVAPRSLVYNWLDEARRFTPELATLDYTGTGRRALRERFAEYDLVITTYGTVRRDAAALSEIRFDYAILDEAQAIKNPDSQTAKAARLVRADHRLALTGTPVENHLRELGSLFEFLNPGMLGRSSTVGDLLGAWTGGNARAPDSEDLARLARALGPFILRRTKEQVLPELPPKTEQTLFVTLGRPQRLLYDQLKAHYRTQISRRIEEHGLNRSRMHVLEALLRLRQAACHPELLGAEHAPEGSDGSDAARDGNGSETAGSAKLDTLFEQLDEVLDEGHKALVFSQFTQLLGLVRRRLDRHGVVYEYLDGQTRDRKKRVERFQEDPDCRLFLISLKAGGTGLNLTAADYVFLLDPWWNPAVEAQAVDRAHRIGQDRPVIAYRLIAQDTVEEKILDLQKTKKDLADAVLSAGGSAFKTLSAEDLELLLS